MLASRCAWIGFAYAAFVACHPSSSSRPAAQEEAFALSAAAADDADDGGFEPNCDPGPLVSNSSNVFFVAGLEATEKRPILIFTRRNPNSGRSTHIVFYEDGTATKDAPAETAEITIAKVLDSPVDVARCVAQKIDGIDGYNGVPHARDVSYDVIDARVGNVWRTTRFQGVSDKDVVTNGPPTTASRLAEAMMVLMEARMSDYATYQPNQKRIEVQKADPPQNMAFPWPADLPAPPSNLEWSAPPWGSRGVYFVDNKSGLRLAAFLASHQREELVAPGGTHIMLFGVSDALPDAAYLEGVEKCVHHTIPNAQCAAP